MEFEWDDANSEKVARRGYYPDDLSEVLFSRYVILRNKRDRAGSHRLVGRTPSGALVTIVIATGSQTGCWRPVTAWPSDAEETRHAHNQGV